MATKEKLQKLNEAMAALEGALQLLSDEHLSILSGGVLNLQEMAKSELRNRGLDKNGKWVGYEG